MRVRAKLFRIVRGTAIALAALLLITLCVVQTQERLLRHRTERLLADFHSLEIDRSTWPEAQRVMARWRKWSYATGECTPDRCIVTIAVRDTFTMRLSAFPELTLPNIVMGLSMRYLQWFGWRTGSMTVRLSIEDGRLATKEMNVSVGVSDSGFRFPMGVAVRAYSTLARDKSFIFYESQMQQHPDYIVTRPGGCTICRFAWVDFASQISNEELNRITDFKLDCFTALHPCEYPGNLLPSIASYHLYEDKQWQPTPRAVCSTSSEARARDAKIIFIVDVLSQAIVSDPDESPAGTRVEQAMVRPVITLKGTFLPPSTIRIAIVPFSPYGDEPQSEHPARVSPGKRYILFLDNAPFGNSIPVDECGIVLDTPSVRSEVMRGTAQRHEVDLPLLSW